MQCTKCGSEKVGHRFHMGPRNCSYGSHSQCGGEHLHHYCQTCGYDWTGPTQEQLAPKESGTK